MEIQGMEAAPAKAGAAGEYLGMYCAQAAGITRTWPIWMAAGSLTEALLAL